MHYQISRSIRFLCFLLSIHTPPLSPAAEVVVGNVCWYTVDTILKLWSSGFASDLNNKIQERQRYDALLRDIIARFEAAHTTATIESTDASERVTPHDENHPVTTDIAPPEAVITHNSSCPQATDTHDTICIPHAPSYPKTNFTLGGTNVADQFLKPGEIFDADTGTRIQIYRNDRGDYGLQTQIGTTNVKVGTNAASIFNFIRALGDWLCDSDHDDASAGIYNSYDTPIKKTPEQKEAIHRWCLQRFKADLAQKIPQRRDAWLQQRTEALQSCKCIQLKAIRTYNAHLAIATTAEHIEQLTDAKRSAEQSIETFDAELDAIQKEKDARNQKNSAQNKQSSYADISCTSPGGKDPRDKDEKERYNGPKYSNMNEVFRKEKIGKRLQECSERIKGEKFKGAQVYRVKKDMPEFGLYEGDVFYLDTYHGDHIEAFKDNFEGSPRNVLSVDGRSLPDKLKKAIQDGRTYKPR